MSQTQVKKELRRQIFQKRKQLSTQEINQSASAIARNAKQFAALQKARYVASYRSFAGEACPLPLEKSLTADIFLPRIRNFRLRQMAFLHHQNNERDLLHNKLGIQEPSANAFVIQPKRLDVALIPLVAFNRQGVRAGMGAGFYDRAFSFRNRNESLPKPLLIGIAHAFQEVEELKADAWDVNLDAIITDHELIVV